MLDTFLCPRSVSMFLCIANIFTSARATRRARNKTETHECVLVPLKSTGNKAKTNTHVSSNTHNKLTTREKHTSKPHSHSAWPRAVEGNVRSIRRFHCILSAFAHPQSLMYVHPPNDKRDSRKSELLQEARSCSTLAEKKVRSMSSSKPFFQEQQRSAQPILVQYFW